MRSAFCISSQPRPGPASSAAVLGLIKPLQLWQCVQSLPRRSDVGFSLHDAVFALAELLRRVCVCVELRLLLALAVFVRLLLFALALHQTIVDEVADEEPDAGQHDHRSAAQVHVLVVLRDVH